MHRDWRSVPLCSPGLVEMKLGLAFLKYLNCAEEADRKCWLTRYNGWCTANKAIHLMNTFTGALSLFASSLFHSFTHTPTPTHTPDGFSRMGKGGSGEEREKR